MAEFDVGPPEATLYWRRPDTAGYLPLFTCPAVLSGHPDIVAVVQPSAEPPALRRCTGTVGFFVTTAIAMIGYLPAEGDSVFLYAAKPSNPDEVGEKDGPLALDAPLRLENGKPRSQEYYLHIIVAAEPFVVRLLYPKSIRQGRVRPSVEAGRAQEADFAMDDQYRLVVRDGLGGRMVEDQLEGEADNCHLEPSSRGQAIFEEVVGRRCPSHIGRCDLDSHRAGMRLEHGLHQAMERGDLGFYVVPNYTAAADGSPLPEVDRHADSRLQNVCARLLPMTKRPLDIAPVSRPIPDELAEFEVPLYVYNYAWASFWAGTFGTTEYSDLCEKTLAPRIAKKDKRNRDSVTTGSAFRDDDNNVEDDEDAGSSASDDDSGSFRYESPSSVLSWSRRVAEETAVAP